MKHWWQCNAGALTEADCNWLRDFASKYNPQTATTGHGGKSTVDEKMRRSVVRWLPRDHTALQWLYMRIEKFAGIANRKAFGLNIASLGGGFDEIQFTEYHGGSTGHYDWHTDNTWKHPDPYDRKLSMVIQLSKPDEYKGGRLRFEHDDLPEGTFANQGDMIFFPSHLRHKVEPVTEGVRFSLVTWFYGPKLA